MASKHRDAPETLHRRAQQAVLTAMSRGEDLDGLTEAVAPTDVSHWFTPDVAILELAVTAGARHPSRHRSTGSTKAYGSST